MAETLTNAEAERLDHMCKVAADTKLGTMLKEIYAELADHESRIVNLEGLT
jgi:hypothetical protein